MRKTKNRLRPHRHIRAFDACATSLSAPLSAPVGRREHCNGFTSEKQPQVRVLSSSACKAHVPLCICRLCTVLYGYIGYLLYSCELSLCTNTSGTASQPPSSL